MKKVFLVLVLIIGLVMTCLFGGLHLGQICPTDAGDFASHIGPEGSNHLVEFGGIDGAANFLQGVANGDIAVSVYGDATRTIIAATSSTWGPAVIIYGSAVLPTMFTATTDRINDLIRGMPKRTSGADLGSARNTAGCFGKALQPTSIPIPVNVPADNSPLIIWAAILLGGGLLIGGAKKVFGGLSA